MRASWPYAGKVASLRMLIQTYTEQIGTLDEVIADLLAGRAGYAVSSGYRGSARSWPRSLSPRSGMSPASTAPPSCAPGSG
jgi:hypothetical protein